MVLSINKGFHQFPTGKWIRVRINKLILVSMQKKTVLTVIMLVFLPMVALPQRKGLASLPTIYLYPSHNTAVLGKVFSVNVSISDIQEPGVYAYEFKLYYDNGLLQAIAWNLPEGHFLTPAPDEMPIYIVPASGIYQDKGYVLVAVTLQTNAKGKTGSGVLATVTFNVTDIGSCALDISDTVLADPDINDIPHDVVDGYFTACGPPKVVFTYSPGSPFINQEVTFNAADSKSSSGEIINYMWNFGDSTPTVTETDPITNYAYTVEGTYIVTLNVTDSEGLSSTVSKLIKILGPCGPTANFTCSPTPLENQTVTFNASVSELGWNGTCYAPIITYEWNFGDGTRTIVTSDSVTTHVFTRQGNYTVTLNVTDTRGLWNVTSCKILVTKPTAVYVEPPYYYGKELDEVFTIEVNVDNVQDVIAFEFKLSYDTAILNATDIALGPFLNEPTRIVAQEIDNEIGRIVCAAYSLSPDLPAYGSGVLATITFKVTGTGVCIFHLYDFIISTPDISSPPEVPVIIPPIHNLAIVSAVPSATEVYDGQIVNITVVTKNWGNALESFNVTVYYDAYIVETKTITDLTAGSEATLIFKWNTTGVEPHKYTIKAEASAVSDEISTADNVYNNYAVEVKKMVDAGGDKAPYIILYILLYGLASTLIITIVATAIYVKRRKKKQ